jgi:hypothetical protein
MLVVDRPPFARKRSLFSRRKRREGSEVKVLEDARSLYLRCANCYMFKEIEERRATQFSLHPHEWLKDIPCRTQSVMNDTQD